MNDKKSVLDVLLRSDLPDMRKSLPEKKVEIPRLSKLAGEPVIFTLRGLTYDQVRRIMDKPTEEHAIYGVLYGCADPVWKNAPLDKERGIATPVDVVKSMLLSGEVDELYAKIQKLSGYLRSTLSEVKND